MEKLSTYKHTEVITETMQINCIYFKFEFLNFIELNINPSITYYKTDGF